MRGPYENFAASNGVGVGVLGLVILAAGVLAGVMAWRKYLGKDTDNAVLLGALAVVAVSVARSVLSK